MIGGDCRFAPTPPGLRGRVSPLSLSLRSFIRRCTSLKAELALSSLLLALMEAAALLLFQDELRCLVPAFVLSGALNVGVSGDDAAWNSWRTLEHRLSPAFS